MRILILSWRGPGHPNEGGAEQVTHEHAKAWVAAGHEVTLFTSTFPGAKKREVVDGVVIERRGDQILGVQLFAPLYYLLQRPRFDLVIDQFHGIPFFTPLYVKVPKLAFIHEVAREVWGLNSLPWPLNLVPAKLGPKIEPLFFKNFYKKVPFLTVSESTRDDLITLSINKKNVTVIRNGVNLKFSKKLPNKGGPKVAIFLGPIAKDKGVEDALRAFSEIERKDDRWKYWVVGKGAKKELSEMKNMARDLGISAKIQFWGFVSDKKKFDLLAKAFILINPSIHEGWGLVNIEANGTSTPVVGYDVHGTRDSVVDGKTGYLVEKGNFRALAEKALYLSRNENIYKRMQGESLKWSKNFNWEKSTKESLKLIENL